MKKSLYALLAMSLACATPRPEVMYCYKYGSCGEKRPVTTQAISIDYLADHNGQNQWIVVKDKQMRQRYRLVRNEATNKLELIVDKYCKGEKCE